jgi:predicted O-methyltransferase YrrM
MNCAVPEKAALEYFWPRMAHGGIILLDDYGWRGYENQKRTHDNFAASVGHEVLPLPTGQGLIVRLQL